MQPSQFRERLLSPRALAGLLAGGLVLLASLLLPAPAGLPPAGWQTLGLGLLMAIWWSTEPLPIGITALLPLIVLPLLGIQDMAATAAPYANPLVFLFLGGFLLAAAVQRWGLHRRLAYAAVRMIGAAPRRLVLGFMVGTAFLSLWLSNTATVVLMLPIAVSVIAAVEESLGDKAALRHFAPALLLGLAYAATIGGLGTLIGTPPNALLAGYLSEQHGVDLSFAAWSAIAMPVVLLMLPLTWLLLTRLVFPVAAHFGPGLAPGDLLRGLADPGPLTPAQRRVLAVFLLAASLWILRPLLNRMPGLAALGDPGIALFCAAALFLIPSGIAAERRFLMSWAETRGISWDVLLLFGGGLSLAAAIDSSGLAVWIGNGLAGLGALPLPLFLLLLVSTVLLFSEMASNTAAVAAMLPIVSTIAAKTGVDLMSLSVAVTMAGSCGFMLPVATPPNALVFATGHLSIGTMMRAGLLLNLLSVILVTLAAYFLAPLLG